MPSPPIFIATRGSALALAQANLVLAQCRAAFPKLKFELKIIKTTGDKLQTASLAEEGKTLPKGLFTKELEVALLRHTAYLAVHSLKDLPTELPAGLKLGAVGKRADVRDVLIYRDEAYLRAAAQDSEATEWSPGRLGIEVRADDQRSAAICARLNHFNTQQCVTAERAFLAAMGGGCQSPVAAYAEAEGDKLHLRALTFANGPPRRAEARRPINEAVELGQQLAALLKA